MEVKNTMDKVIDMKLDDMKEEQEEKEKKQNNVLLYNVPEKLEGTNDKEVVENLILQELGVKEAKVEEITRLGTGYEPILLKLNDLQAQTKVLSNVKLPRNARSEMHRNIYLATEKQLRRGKSRESYKQQPEKREL